MKLQMALLLAGSLVSTTALAAPNLVTTMTQPTARYVYEQGRFDIDVRNLGPHTANSVALTIQLPTTNTSPQVYLMGTLGAKSANCTQSGHSLTCSLGQLKKNKSASVYFNMALPQSSAPINFTATATSPSGEGSPADNTDTLSADLDNYSVPITAPASATNEHCTGTGLTSFYECTLFPSSISGYPFTFLAGGGLYFPTAPPEISGIWSQPSSEELTIAYYDDGVLAATFVGFGTSPDCFEGLTTFPGPGGWVSPYQICLD